MNALSNLREALLNPACAGGFSLAEWDVVLRMADVGLLTASLATRIEKASFDTPLPAAIQARLHAATIKSAANRRGAVWEVNRLERALAPLGLQLVLLKGAAYALSNLPAGQGRVFGDVDILVPKARLAELEETLFWHGWINTHHDAYDNRYYREWMHELPPLMHQKRQSVLDVHHTILPPTARFHPDPEKLHADAVPIQGQATVRVLSPADMVIHSACHLFHESEWDSSLRDLFDLDRLFRDFGEDETFFHHLVGRAYELELQRPLYYAFRYAEWMWRTPIPESAKRRLVAARPALPVRLLMDALIPRALIPRHPLAQRGGDRLVRFCLYVRGHWLRMPLHLLLPHLLRKAFKPYFAERKRV